MDLQVHLVPYRRSMLIRRFSTCGIKPCEALVRSARSQLAFDHANNPARNLNPKRGAAVLLYPAIYQASGFARETGFGVLIIIGIETLRPSCARLCDEARKSRILSQREPESWVRCKH